MAEVVHIVLVANQPYFDGLVVTAFSIAEHANQNDTLVFHILDGGVEDSSFAMLKSGLGKWHNKVEVERILVSEVAFAAFPDFAGSRMTYARLLLPELLPHVKHVIYSDVDFVWLHDVSLLWKERTDFNPLVGVPDGGVLTLEDESEWCDKHGKRFDAGQYICAGMAIWNLELMRREGGSKVFMDFLTKYPDVKHHDQSTINHLYSGRIKIVSSEWQQFSMRVVQEDLGKPIVLHYAGESSWKIGEWYLGIADARRYWYKLLARYLGMGVVAAYLRHYPNIFVLSFRYILGRMIVTPVLKDMVFAFFTLCHRPNIARELKGISRRLIFRLED